MVEYYKITENCIACGVCVSSCPFGAIVETKDSFYEIDLDECVGCGVCADECPIDAIELI